MKQYRLNFSFRSFSFFLCFTIILSSLPFAVFTASADREWYNPFTQTDDGIATAPTVYNPFVPNGKPQNPKQGALPSNPFFLDSIKDLEILADIVNGTGDYESNGAYNCENYYFKVAKNIGSKGNEFKNRIGLSPSCYFNGSFDGDRHSIWVDLSDPKWKNETYVGLFGFTGSYATIQNVIVRGEVKGTNFVSGVVGLNRGSVANCDNFATVTGRDVSYAVGGVVGLNDSGSVANCANFATVQDGGGSSSVGGVVGLNNGSSVVNCTNFATVTGGDGSNHVGGVVGLNTGSVANCDNFATVTGGDSSNHVGGVVGNIRGIGSVVNCANYSKVIGIDDVGGVVGLNNGGFVVNCFNSGFVSGSKNVGGVVGKDLGLVAYSYYDTSKYENGSAIGNQDDTGNILGLTKAQCQASKTAPPDETWKIVSCSISNGTALKSLVALLSDYCETYNTQSQVNWLATVDVIAPDQIHSIKLLNWKIDDTVGTASSGYPILIKEEEEDDETSIDKVNVNMFLAKPAIGCRLPNAKAFSKTDNVNVTNVRTTWFDGTHRIATKAHLGGKYTAMVSFKLATAEEYDIADNAKVWVRLNGKLVRATKRGDTYTVACSFKKLSICNVLSDIYKNLFWRIF